MVGTSLNLSMSKERFNQNDNDDSANEKDHSRLESNDTARNSSTNHIAHRGFVSRRNSKHAVGSNSGGPRQSSRRSISKGNASNSNLGDSVSPGGAELALMKADLLQVQKIQKNPTTQTPRGVLASMSIDSEDFLKQANAGAMNNSFGKNPTESH